MAVSPTLEHELSLWRRGYQRVAGIDEVGRGPLAGPVAAAALLLPPKPSFPGLDDVRDSKQLTAQARSRLAPLLQKQALAFGLGCASPQEIDRLGIVTATRLAMARAVAQLTPPPDFLLIDAIPLPELAIPYQAIIHGDATCCSIAAASIVAKVARDRMMTELEAQYPGYGFARHKGYPTPSHLTCLERLGPSPVHRRSFAPVRRLLEGRHG